MMLRHLKPEPPCGQNFTDIITFLTNNFCNIKNMITNQNIKISD